MKRYNLSEIMKNAHRTYKYVEKKQGKTFSECLKSTWKLAKAHVTMEELMLKLDVGRKRKADEFIHVKAEKVQYTFDGDVYNRNSIGYMSSQYCGD